MMLRTIEDDFEIADAYPLMDEVARSEGWEDPEMDLYNQLREPEKRVSNGAKL